MRKIYLDVDDTLGDFKAAALAGGVPDWRGTWYTEPRETWDADQLEIDRLTCLLMESADFWLTMPVAEGAAEIMEYAKNLGEVYLLTALPRDAKPENKGMIRESKMTYCTEVLGFPADRIIICERKDKVQYAVHEDILVDDATRNCQEWAAAGGVAILHTDWRTTMFAMRAILDRK